MSIVPVALPPVLQEQSCFAVVRLDPAIEDTPDDSPVIGLNGPQYYTVDWDVCTLTPVAVFSNEQAAQEWVEKRRTKDQQRSEYPTAYEIHQVLYDPQTI